MILAIVALVALGLGVVLIITGTAMTWRSRGPDARAASGDGGLIGAMAKLAEALAKYPPGMVMVFLGVLLVFLAAVAAGVNGVT